MARADSGEERLCACGSGLAPDKCCLPVIKGDRAPSTAEELLRARYTSFTLGELAFVERSTHPRSRADFDRQATRDWMRSSDWQELEILSVEGGGEEDDEALIDFVARYEQNDEEMAHHERASFARHEGRWYFADGKWIGPETFVREQPKVGRNDPCPCGSGKKYKKCCGR